VLADQRGGHLMDFAGGRPSSRAAPRVSGRDRCPASGFGVDDFVGADISTAAGVDTVAEHVRRRGGAQIIVHVAGGSGAPAGGFATLNEQDWADELNVNLLAAVRLDRALVPAMIDAGSGAIVHII
jgi:NAD(P)-dependent dehydrogenase (short-subunit alcohol dehydrogenase family)